jgi:hypothetical protein
MWTVPIDMPLVFAEHGAGMVLVVDQDAAANDGADRRLLFPNLAGQG